MDAPAAELRSLRISGNTSVKANVRVRQRGIPVTYNPIPEVTNSSGSGTRSSLTP